MPIDLPKRIADNIDRFTGRTWLLPTILEWWDKSDERLFLLTGGPGTGKSMILAWLAGRGPMPEAAEAQQQLAALRARFKASHFCVADSGSTDPRDLACQMARQLTRKVPGFGEALAATMGEQVQITSEQHVGRVEEGGSVTGIYIANFDLGCLSEELSFNRILRDPLKHLYGDGYDEPMLLLVDSLDEALTYSGATNVVQLLAKLSDLPPQVRILATTRDEPRVLKFFSKVKPFDLIKEATPDVDDVQIYTEVRMGTISVVEEVKRKEFSERLTQQAAGVFLYAASVLDELLERSPSELPDLETYPLPDGLSGLYYQFLTRELGKDDQRWFDLYEPLLGLIAVAQGEGLTVQQLTELIGKDVRAVLRASKQYLTGELPHGPFRPFHKSFADFLLEDSDNKDFHIDSATMHGRIVEHYWSHKLDWSKCDDYGLNNLAVHLSSSNRLGDMVDLIDHSWMRVRYERGGFTYSEFQTDIDLATQAVLAVSPQQLGHLIHLKAVALAVQEHVRVYEDQDLAILVGLKRTEEALVHARLRNSPQGRFQGFMTIYRALMPSPPPSTAMTLSGDARTAANAIGDGLERVRALCSLASELSRPPCPGLAEALDDGKQCIYEIQDERHRATAQRELVSALVEATRLDDAELIAASIDNDVERAFALNTIAISLADSGDISKAIRLSDSIKTSAIYREHSVQWTHARTLAGIARALAAADDTRAAVMFQDAERAAKSIEDVSFRDNALQDVTAALTHSRRFSEAQRVATLIDGWRKSQALSGLVDAFAKAGDFEKARALVDAIPDVQWRSFAHRDIAQELACSDRYDEARSIEREINEITIRVSTLLAIASALFQKRDYRADYVLDEALKLCVAIKSPSDRASAFRHMTRILLKAQDLDRASRIFGQVHQEAGVKRDDRKYCAALREMAIALASVDDSHANSIIDDVGASIETLEGFQKMDEKREFATSLIRVGRFHRAWQVLESDNGDILRGDAWRELAICLLRSGDHRADMAFRNAQAPAREMNDTSHDELLAKLVVALIEERQFEMAEGLIPSMKEIYRRSEALTRLGVALHQNDSKRALELFSQAEEMTRKQWGSDYTRDRVLVGVVSGLTESGEFDNALRVVSTIETDGHRVTALSYLAGRLVLVGDPRGQDLLDEGLRLASSGRPGDGWYEAKTLRQEAALLSREGDWGASALWARAEEMAGSLWDGWIWGNTQYRAQGILKLAMALAMGNDPRTDSTFALCHHTAISIPYENARDETLSELVNALIEVDRLDDAKRVLADIHGDSKRLTVVRDLVTAFITTCQLDAALQLARSVPTEYHRRKIIRNVAVAFARVDKMTDALQVLEETSLDEFIGALAMVHAAWSAAHPGAVITSMRTVTSVAAWVRSDWNEIHKVLMT